MSLPDSSIMPLSCSILVYCFSCYLTLKEEPSYLWSTFQIKAKKSRADTPSTNSHISLIQSASLLTSPTQRSDTNNWEHL